VNRPPIVHDCTICGLRHEGRFYVVHDRLLTLCHDCWRWDVLSVLDTLNIPTTEEPCPAD
jgi:hypothetical protein